MKKDGFLVPQNVGDACCSVCVHVCPDAGCWGVCRSAVSARSFISSLFFEPRGCAGADNTVMSKTDKAPASSRVCWERQKTCKKTQPYDEDVGAGALHGRRPREAVRRWGN